MQILCVTCCPCIEYGFYFDVQYEPELFPGLIYRMKQPKIVLLIFVSGKIVLTGAKVMPNVWLLLEFLGFSLLDFMFVLDGLT